MRSEACWARVAVSGQNPSVLADNAAAESFLGTLKKELVNRNDYQVRHQVRLSIRYWIEAWYKPCRLHSSVGYQPAIEFCVLLATMHSKASVSRPSVNSVKHRA